MGAGLPLAACKLAPDLDSRVKLAANPASPPGVLAGLASDGSIAVRAAVALNPSTPRSAEAQLVMDPDERVRLLLARKLANALPGLSGPSQADLRERTLAILADLVRDEAVRIRSVIATALASLPDLPHALALALAHDGAIPVSEPVLRLSPLLSADDLLGLLAAPPHGETAAAIACRANLPACVADRIAASANSPAIRALLGNASAAIRESTLDALISRAASEPDWHAPLVRRPRLPDHAARALAEIVAGQLLGELAARAELSPAVVAVIRQRLASELPGRPPVPSDADLVNEARKLEDCGLLGEVRLLACLRAGEDRRASAMLAVAAGVPLGVVDRAASLRSAKGLVSLVWKAGFSVRAIGPVQTALGQIGPGAMLTATQSGDFPLGPEEMGWQLEFLTGGSR